MIKAFRILWLDEWIPKTHLPLFISNYENFCYFHYTVLGFWRSTGKKYFLLSPLPAMPLQGKMLKMTRTATHFAEGRFT